MFMHPDTQVRRIQQKQKSAELQDTIKSMKDIQEWMSDLRLKEWGQRLFFVGRFSQDCLNENAIAQDIIETLELDTNPYTSVDIVIKSFCEKLQQIGVSIFKDSTVMSNQERELSPFEFSVFSLYDEYAPLVFINTAASLERQFYGLIYETVSIWLGEDHVFGVSDNDLFYICIAEKILLFLFPYGWDKKAELVLGQDKSYNSHARSIDRYFLQSLYASIREGTISYTGAYRLVNAWGDNFENLVAQTLS